ncbi:hypothetical protein CTP10_R58880 [Cupriavidus sp. P-10]|uniref:hypothetical protein n=1 Tax=unclassified Cupriavidus TaxID=2640874 RepID=UPI000EBDB6D5|nr:MULTISPECIES: hypothetical protein [unclassified Cupriavidus]BDB28477.1 hypothetical protein CTP10_R58880 [Cupriavidus sp. P-10]
MMTAMVVGTAHGAADGAAHITLQRKHAYSRIDGWSGKGRKATLGGCPRFSGTVAMIGQT